MATLFYKTKKDSTTGKKMNELVEKGRSISKKIQAYVDELGGTEKYLMRGKALFGTGIVGINFIEQPDDKIWKKYPKIEGYFLPRLSSPKGKEISEKLDSFEIIEREDVNEIIGFKSFLSHCGYSEECNGFLGFEISSEWKHEMPKDCEEITFTEYQNLFNKK